MAEGAKDLGGARGIVTRIGADLPKRVAAGLVLMALALATTWRGGAVFAIFWLIAAAAILWEWQSLVGAQGLGPRLATGGLALLAASFLALNGSPSGAVLAALIGVAACAELARRSAAIGPLWAAAGVLYASSVAIAVIALRQESTLGRSAIFWLFAVVWGADIMAYFGGRLIGGPKLWPRVSPGKTWSGFLIGVFCGALLGTLAAPGVGNIGWVFFLSLATGAVSQGGDLAESAFKRRWGVKDSSALIPGHGGVMDRLDGFIAAAAFAALIAAWRSGSGELAAGLF